MAEPGRALYPAPYPESAPNPWISGMLMTLPMALALVGNDGRILATNEALDATCGEASQPGVLPSALFVDEDQARVAGMVAKICRGLGPYELRASLRARPDEEQVVSMIPVPPGLRISGLLAMRDVREQLRLEKQVAAVTRMQAVGQLAGGIAHDFNNILTAVLGLTDQLIARHGFGSADHSDLNQIRINARRAAALVEQLLAFARQQPRKQRVLDLEATVLGLRPLLEQLIGPAVRLTIDAPGLGHAVHADASQIEQVIVNLAVNARDAMSGAGSLTIALRDMPADSIAAQGHAIIPAADHVMVSVTDTGTGIPPAIAGKIFEPFFSTKPQGQGTGLGLSTVYGIVKQSDGYVFARPASGGGTVFNLYFPAVPRAGLVATRTEPPRVLQPQPAPSTRVLLVEDDTAVRTVLERGLRRSGLLVEAVDGGEAALARLRSPVAPVIDVLVSDVMMPGIDGVELVDRVRAFRPDLGVVLMSGFAEPPLHRTADRQGVNFLAKPFATADLVAAIARAGGA